MICEGLSLSLSDFFQEAVQRLCGTLKLETALADFFDFLRRHVPVTGFVLGRSRFDTQTMDLIAMCTEDGTVHMLSRRLAHTPEQMRITAGVHAAELAQCDSPDGVMAWRDDEFLGRFLALTSGALPQPVRPPLFFLRMRQAEQVYGGATFTCSPDAPFTEEHRMLLRTLRIPLLIALNNWFQYEELKELKERIWRENLRLRQQLNGLSRVEVIGAHSGLARVMEKVRLAGPMDVSVLITGETGTGKEVIARAVHDLSPRADKPFVAVNCGGIPPSLIDSELFGHVKGAFTGAVSYHKGRFERAQGGTIFLDEVGELPLPVQARLLRVLQERGIEPVGGGAVMPVNFRLVAATNRDLEEMVKEGLFRQDLYYRMRVVPIHLPPLRERKQDIPLLVDHLLARTALRFGVRTPELAPGQLNRLLEHRWPGNVRELQNVLEEAMVLMPEGPLRFWAEEAPRRCEAAAENLPSLNETLARYFWQLLEASGGRIAGPGGAAEKAGINANTLRSKLDKLGIPHHGRAKGGA